MERIKTKTGIENKSTGGGGGKRYKITDLYIIICPAAMAKKDHTNTHTNISPKSNQSPQYTTEQNCR